MPQACSGADLQQPQGGFSVWPEQTCSSHRVVSVCGRSRPAAAALLFWCVGCSAVESTLLFRGVMQNMFYAQPHNSTEEVTNTDRPGSDPPTWHHTQHAPLTPPTHSAPPPPTL